MLSKSIKVIGVTLFTPSRNLGHRLSYLNLLSHSSLNQIVRTHILAAHSLLRKASKTLRRKSTSCDYSRDFFQSISNTNGTALVSTHF